MKNPVRDKLTSSDKRKIEQKIEQTRQKQNSTLEEIEELELIGDPKGEAAELIGEIEELEYQEEFLEETLLDIVGVTRGGSNTGYNTRMKTSVNYRRSGDKSWALINEGFRLVRTKK